MRQSRSKHRTAALSGREVDADGIASRAPGAAGAGTGSSGFQLVGRERQLAAIRSLLGSDGHARALLFEGGAGMGKTTLWWAGVSAARQLERSVVIARPSGADVHLAFAGLVDLLTEVDSTTFAILPDPQRHALEVALLRAQPLGTPVEPRAVALGLLNTLRAVARHRPVVVAVDDLQWLDAPSAQALAFAARRLERDPVRFIFTQRSGPVTVVESALERGLERLEVGPLGLSAIRRILADQLGFTPPRPLLRSVFESAAGNPLFALELGRTLAERSAVGLPEDIALPERVEDLLGARVASQPAPVLRVLLAAALASDLHTAQLAAIAGSEAVRDAVRRGVLVLEGDRARPSHPLLAAAARKRSSAQERRALHRVVAGVVSEEELRARHQALAATGPDPELAAVVAGASERAGARGAVRAAADLAEYALGLTPTGSPERPARVLWLAERLLVCGDYGRISDLLSPEVPSFARASDRARAHLLLSEVSPDYRGHGAHLEQALRESGELATLRATALAQKAIFSAVIRVEAIPQAEVWAREAMSTARVGGAAVMDLARQAMVWTRLLGAREIDDLRPPGGDGEPSHELYTTSFARLSATQCVFRGRVAEARPVFRRLLAAADERGEERSYEAFQVQLCELELRAGDMAAAAAILQEWDQSIAHAAPLRCRAHLAATRGLVDEAADWAAQALAVADATGSRWDGLEALRARGIADLARAQPARAVESLEAVWEHVEQEGVRELGAFPVAPDLVEALLATRAAADSEAVIGRLGQLAGTGRHPWAAATLNRCRALLQLDRGQPAEPALGALAAAAAAYDHLGLRFDAARCLLLLGRAQRRLKMWGAARRALDRAVAAFEAIDAPGWATQAESERDRVGARRPAPAGQLTPAEGRVADLAASGLANKDIARALHVSVHTVEIHLSRVYAKLGIRSRAQLARRLASTSPEKD